MMTETPRVSYWHLWADADGVSHQSQCVMTDFELKSIKRPADPQWQGKTTTGHMTVMVTVLPVGWSGAWHKNPKAQWIVPLSGRWFVEAMDGNRIDMGAGEVSFGGDQNCREVQGKVGHRSGTVGDLPAVLLLIQFNDIAAPRSACEFR